MAFYNIRRTSQFHDVLEFLYGEIFSWRFWTTEQLEVGERWVEM